MKNKALILYSSITGNTEKIANWFKETFEFYRMETTIVKITPKTDWKSLAGKTNFEDFDVVCLGSPIIAGSPMMPVIKAFSLGGGTDLEKNVTANAESGKTYNAGSGTDPGSPDGPGGPGSPMGSGNRPIFHGSDYMGSAAMYPGGPPPQNIYKPLGIVFTTYGGGFFGSRECLATIELLKLYLELNNVSVIGKFACCGKEYGPAGVPDGEIPRTMGGKKLDPPVYYEDAAGNKHAGSFFFHTHMNSKPGPRDEAKAKALVADLVEDYFYSHDGQRKEVGSEYISIS